MEKRSVERFDSSPIRDPKDGSSGRIDVADGNIMGSLETMAKAVQAPRGPEYQSEHLGSSQRNDTSPYRSMRMDGRLVPFNLEDSDGFHPYQTDLENFYFRYKNPADVSIADAAFKCLKNESKLRLYWLALKASVIPSDAFLSNNIFDCMLRLVQNAGESEAPFFIDAAAGCKVPHFQCTLSQDIRRCALKVAMFPGKWSPDIAAVLLGIIKEAELILENMKCGNLDAIDTSHKIRRFAIEFLRHKFGEIEQSDEMTSDVDGEVNQPRSTRGTGEVEKNSLEKKCHFMDKQPKKQKTESGLDFLTLLKKGYLTRKTIIATDMCGDKGRMKAFYVPIP